MKDFNRYFTISTSLIDNKEGTAMAVTIFKLKIIQLKCMRYLLFAYNDFVLSYMCVCVREFIAFVYEILKNQFNKALDFSVNAGCIQHKLKIQSD